MGSLQTVLPFKLAATEETLTAQGGLALFGEYLSAMCVGALIGHELPGPGSAAHPSASSLILAVIGVTGRNHNVTGSWSSRSLPVLSANESRVTPTLSSSERCRLASGVGAAQRM